MRSELVFGAMSFVSNRYLLTKLASKATRELHRPNTRIQDTMNDVFGRFSRATPMAGVQNGEAVKSFPCTAHCGAPLSRRLKRSVA
jgi:hypothetical protein